MEQRPSTSAIGCRPKADRSMIASRRWPSAIGPAFQNPSPSGPRWASREVMRRTASQSGAAVQERAPAMPHISAPSVPQQVSAAFRTDPSVTISKLDMESAERRKLFFYNTIADRLDQVLNRYDLDRRLEVVFDDLLPPQLVEGRR